MVLNFKNMRCRPNYILKELLRSFFSIVSSHYEINNYSTPTPGCVGPSKLTNSYNNKAVAIYNYIFIGNHFCSDNV